MTSSQWLDIAILAVALIAAISGWRSGAPGSLLALVGVALGAVAGVLWSAQDKRVERESACVLYCVI